MFAHIRAQLLLLVVTLVVCAGLYPLALWGIGQAVFPAKANGSLIVVGDKVVGSAQIAQPFAGDEYLQPRPSAASYNAAASGGSNLGANNPKLRGRVAQQLGTVAYFRDGKPVGPAVEAWFAAKPDRAKTWADDNPTLAGVWVKSDPLITKYVETTVPNEKIDDAAGPFFAKFAAQYPARWPAIVDEKAADGKVTKVVKPVPTGSDIQGIFFESWFAEQKGVDLEPVPADMVTASGSGLDPHVTLSNALYQVRHRIAATRRGDLEAFVRGQAFSPLGGLAGGEPLVNVLETNLLLDKKFPKASP